jgi:peptidyl-prolyl cis-trans isomerase C
VRRPFVSLPLSPQSDSTSASGWTRPLARGALVCALALGVAACKPGSPPSGEVIATVNGREITSQDLLAEARASGQTNVNAQQLLQQVIARSLLAQSAHDQKLDAYPGYPSDLVRIEQSFLAEKALRSVVKPSPPPTPQAIAAFEAANPYLFSERVRLQVDQVQFENTDNMKSLQGADDLPTVISKLKALNVPFERKSRTLDTAQIPTEVSAQLAATPLNQLEFLRNGEAVVGIVVLARDPIEVPPDQTLSMATQLIERSGSQRQFDDEVNRLRAKAQIAYQKGYAPAPPKTPAKHS